MRRNRARSGGLEGVLGAEHPILAFPLDTAASIASARGECQRGRTLVARARRIERMTAGPVGATVDPP